MRLRPEEAAAIGALVLLVAAQLHWGGRLHVDTYFAERGTTLLGVVAALYVLMGSRAPRTLLGRGVRFARDWAPFVVLILVYENLLPLVRRIRPELYDSWAMQLDVRWLGSTPSLWLEPLVTRARTEWFAACYLSLFALPLLSGGVLYLTDRRREFRAFMSAFTLAGAVGFVGYLLVPIVGPRYYYPEAYRLTLAGRPLREPFGATSGVGPLTRLTEHANQLPNVIGAHVPNCFPSLHTAWGIIVLVFAYRQARWLFWIYLLPVSSLVFATLYLRFHYMVDVLAGGLLAALTCALFLERREQTPAAAPPRRSSLCTTWWGALSERASLARATLAERASGALPYFAVLTTVVLVYFSSLPSGLTERNRGQDGAELVAAAVTGGTAHPPGYPLYLLLVRGACAIVRSADPIDVAHGMSAACASVAGLAVCWFVRRWLAAVAGSSGLEDVAACASAFAFCFSRPVFSQAVIAEVYALHACLVAFTCCLALRLLLAERARPRDAFAVGVCGALAVTHHLSALPIFAGQSALLAAVAWRKRRSCAASPDDPAHCSRPLASALAGLGGLVVGCTPWLYLPFAARAAPALRWGNPDTIERFWAVVSAAQYRTRVGAGLAEAVHRLGEHFPTHGLTALTLALATVGTTAALYAIRQPAVGVGAALLLVTAIANCASAALYAIPDLDAYFIPTAFSLALFSGLGLVKLGRALSDFTSAPVQLTAGIAALALGPGALVNWRAVDAHGRNGLDRHVVSIVKKAPLGALIVARGDGVVFGLWYEKLVRARRPDVDVVSRELLTLPWYPRLSPHFGAQMRWPEAPLRGSADQRLRAVLLVNYGTRPVVVVHPSDVPDGCATEHDATLTCDPKRVTELASVR